MRNLGTTSTDVKRLAQAKPETESRLACCFLGRDTGESQLKRMRFLLLVAVKVHCSNSTAVGLAQLVNILKTAQSYTADADLYGMCITA